MTKKLTETFVQFTFPADLREIFAEAEVSRIVFDRQKLRLDIYLQLNRVIRPSYIEQLAKSLTAHLGYSVRLWETYRLDGDLSRIYPQWAESLFYYLEKGDPFLANTLRLSQAKISGDQIQYQVPAVGYEYIMPLEPGKKMERLFAEKLQREVVISFYKKDEKSQILQEFIQNRDMESRMLATVPVGQEMAAPAKKVMEKPEGILYGKKEIKGEITPVADLEESRSFYNIDVEIVGEIDVRELRSGKRMVKKRPRSWLRD